MAVAHALHALIVAGGQGEIRYALGTHSALIYTSNLVFVKGFDAGVCSFRIKKDAPKLSRRSVFIE